MEKKESMMEPAWWDEEENGHAMEKINGGCTTICPRCDGTGMKDGELCSYCSGTGWRR